MYHVPEVLNVHINEIYKILTTIKSNKYKFDKITFSFSKVNFSLLEKKIFLKKVNFCFTFVQNFWHKQVPWLYKYLKKFAYL